MVANTAERPKNSRFDKIVDIRLNVTMTWEDSCMEMGMQGEKLQWHEKKEGKN